MNLLQQTLFSVMHLQLIAGVTAAQICIGRESLVADGSGLKTDKKIVNTLSDNIRMGSHGKTH
jgi:hypothetical protein